MNSGLLCGSDGACGFDAALWRIGAACDERGDERCAANGCNDGDDDDECGFILSRHGMEVMIEKIK